jgi:gliding motility-associated-like protein
MKNIIALLLLCSSMAFNVAAQQLVLNEFSQGNSGTREYIELLVVGNKTCTDSCMDIRGWVFDDHNGWYGASAGMGIATGCMRFSNSSTWSCVPYGSLILVYNNGDKNPSITLPDDPTDANQDNVYLVPANNGLIESNNATPVSPSSTSYVYPGSGFSAGGNWNNIGFANTGDAVIVTSPAAPGTAHFSLTYGNVNGGTIHIGTSGSGRVYFQSANLPFSVANWLVGNAGTDETPGLPNTTANANWIISMKAFTGGEVRDTLHETICQGSFYTLNGTNYSSAGVYETTFLRPKNCDSIVTLYLTVSSKPVPPAVVTPVAYCQDSAAILLTGFGFNLRWYTTPKGGVGTYVPPLPSTTVPGTYLYYVTQTVDGCESERTITKVIVNPTPAPPITDTITYCQNDVAKPLVAQGSNLRWYTAAIGGSSIGKAPIPNTAIAGVYKWYVSQAMENCEGGRAEIVVEVLEIDAKFTINNDTLCITDSLICINTSKGDGLSYYWNFGDTTTDVVDNPVHKYAKPGSYKVVLIIGNSNGCSDTAVTYVHIFQVPSVKFSIQDSIICVGTAAMLNVDNTTGIQKMTWDFGDGSMLEKWDDFTNQQHAYDRGGIFNIVFKGYSIACGILEQQAAINVDEHAKVYLGTDTAICPNGAPVVLRDLIENPAKKYLWSTGDTTKALIVRHHGIYSVTATVGTCSSTDSINVHKSCYIDIPNAFSPNGDGVNDFFFPRVLLSRGVSKFNMKIFNRWGQLIFETDRLDGRGWDGKFNGVAQFGGVFVYLVDVEFVNDTREYYQGNVTLLR